MPFDLTAQKKKDQICSVPMGIGITLKLVTSGGSRFRGLAAGNTSPKQGRSGGEPLATLHPI